MRQIDDNIKENNFSQIYLLYGEETFLRRKYRDKLANAIVDKQDTMNYNYFEGKNISVAKLIDLSETLPFFSKRRLIVVENSEFFKTSQEELAKYLENLPSSTYFIFTESAIDKKTKMFKICQKKGHCAEFVFQKENVLRTWVSNQITGTGKKITQRALEIFLERAGSDMENITSEMEKLLCYTLDKEDITASDVEEICTRQVTGKIFEMVDCVSSRRKKDAVELYYDLLSLQEPPRRILSLLTRQFNILYQAKLLRSKGLDNRSIATSIGISPYYINKYVDQASGFQTAKLRKYLEECVKAQEDMNNGKISDKVGVEVLIIQFSSES